MSVLSECNLQCARYESTLDAGNVRAVTKAGSDRNPAA